MQNVIDSYLNIIENTDEYKELIELKKLIDKKYSMLIINMHTKQSEYEESKKYESYIDNKLQKEAYMNAKKELFSKEEVKRYFELENILSNIINKDINDLKKSISNKFINKEIIKM